MHLRAKGKESFPGLLSIHGYINSCDMWGSDNIKEQVKKANKRLYFLRKLKEFSVDTKILNLFYTSVIQSVAVFGLIIWYSSASVMDKKQVDKIRKVAQKIIGSPVTTLNDIYDTKIMCKVKSVINDTSHPLYSCYQWLPSGKRLRSVTCKTKRHAESFVPKSVMILNKNM